MIKTSGNMNFKMKTSLLIFFIAKDLVSVRALDESSKYDITKVLNDSINGIFQKAGWSRVKKTFTKGFHGLSEYKTKNIRKFKIFGDEIIYRGLHFRDVGAPDLISIQWNSAKNETRLQFSGFGYYLDCNMIGALNKTVARFSANPIFTKFAIIITESSTGQNESKIKIEIDYANIMHYESTWLTGYDKTKLKTTQRLFYEFHIMLPKVTRHCLARNKKFKQALTNSLLVYPKRYISSIYPDFSRKERKYYYSIPKISLNSYHLKNITIRGLSNFESFNGTSLQVKNIDGFMTCIIHEALIEFVTFEIDHLFISFNRDNQSITVNAQKYKIKQLNFGDSSSKHESLLLDSLPEFSSVILMRHIESAIANSIMPYMKKNTSTKS
ncbi:uncharacterized protein LOC135834909 isoform X2 [Planococcus citri]|uniref:uncharacterized protein LOC135834909 isoform X2 n=1 Tax=Planococcus citri TaxID=170843 RepID=UPI0031F7DFA3